MLTQLHNQTNFRGGGREPLRGKFITRWVGHLQSGGTCITNRTPGLHDRSGAISTNSIRALVGYEKTPKGRLFNSTPWNRESYDENTACFVAKKHQWRKNDDCGYSGISHRLGMGNTDEHRTKATRDTMVNLTDTMRTPDQHQNKPQHVGNMDDVRSLDDEMVTWTMMNKKKTNWTHTK